MLRGLLSFVLAGLLTINPFALSASLNLAKANGNSTTATNGRIEAADNVYLTSGRDVNLIGGVVAGERVDVEAGRDLNIVSLQDTSAYKSSQFGLSISVAPGLGVSGSFNYGSTKASYANVAEQSGIVAGDGGYRIDAGGNVDLKAGLIVSSADPALNSLEANSLTFSDLQNVSKAKTSSYGLNLSPTGVLTPSVGQPAQMREEGEALSTLSPGQITLHDQNRDGVAGTADDKAATDALLAAINQDRLLTNTQVGMYDLEALKNKQLDAAIISQALNMAVGDIAQAAGFEEGSPQKVALHAAAGAVTALVSGGDIGIGALAGGASEVANAVLVQALAQNPDLDPEQRNAILQWGAVLVGAAIGGGQGAATALDNVNFNYLDHNESMIREKLKQKLAKCESESNCSPDEVASLQQQIDYWDRLDSERDQQLISACTADAASKACTDAYLDALTAMELFKEPSAFPNPGDFAGGGYKYIAMLLRNGGLEGVSNPELVAAIYMERIQTITLLAGMPQAYEATAQRIGTDALWNMALGVGGVLFEAKLAAGKAKYTVPNNNVAPRALTAEDLGIQGNLSNLSGTFSVQNGITSVRVDMIEGSITNPLRIIDKLINTARLNGSTLLQIEGTIANPRLYNVLQRRYGLATQGANDRIVINIE